MLGLFNGLRLMHVPHMVIDTGERSWARVRSHGRARRRLKRGFRQNIDVVWAPDPNVLMDERNIYGHPATLQKLVAIAEAQPHD